MKILYEIYPFRITKALTTFWLFYPIFKATQTMNIVEHFTGIYASYVLKSAIIN